MSVLLTVVEICRSDLFYHMAEFHNFDVGDPDNLGMLVILIVKLVYKVSGFFLLNRMLQFCVFALNDISWAVNCNRARS